MPIKTRRWNDPAEPDDGFRLLVTRYRPRGIAKAQETWDAWEPSLGPSKTLHRAVYTETSTPIPWPVYRNFTDDDLKAIFAYLRTVPAVHNQVPDPILAPAPPGKK